MANLDQKRKSIAHKKVERNLTDYLTQLCHFNFIRENGSNKVVGENSNNGDWGIFIKLITPMANQNLELTK